MIPVLLKADNVFIDCEKKGPEWFTLKSLYEELPVGAQLFQPNFLTVTEILRQLSEFADSAILVRGENRQCGVRFIWE